MGLRAGFWAAPCAQLHSLQLPGGRWVLSPGEALGRLVFGAAAAGKLLAAAHASVSPPPARPLSRGAALRDGRGSALGLGLGLRFRRAGAVSALRRACRSGSLGREVLESGPAAVAAAARGSSGGRSAGSPPHHWRCGGLHCPRR